MGFCEWHLLCIAMCGRVVARSVCSIKLCAVMCGCALCVSVSVYGAQLLWMALAVWLSVSGVHCV